MGKLTDLAERCEKATFPCPDDAAAAEVVAIRSAICLLMTGRGYDAYSPDHVGSLDDAMALVPTGPDYFPRVSRLFNLRWRADIYEQWQAVTWAGEGCNAALAICAAALRARAASVDRSPEGGGPEEGRHAKHESATAESGDAQPTPVSDPISNKGER